ncbi:MAG: Glucose--fructose oxidoreductase [Phycisphaerae bacterium]|nr:Glucose--fructose oxidoreductase [Phycisphaerae bacterium]
MAGKKGKAIRVAVIGAGSIGLSHAKAIVASGGQLAFVVDVNKAAAEKMAADHGGQPVADYRQVLDRDDVDAVTVALPNFLHAPVSIAALKAGKHVFCEKPMAMNVAECKQINAAARKARRVFQVGLHHRHMIETAAAKELIDAGRCGKLYHAQVNAIRRRGVPGRGGWFTTRSKAGGGPMADIGVHMLDLTCYLMGHPKPVAVSAQTFQKMIHRDDYTCTGMWASPVPGGPTDVEDAITALIRFENGATADLQCAWALNTVTNKWQTEVFGDQAGILVKPGDGIVVAGQEGSRLVDTTPLLPKGVSPFNNQFAAFFEFCRTGKQPRRPSASGADGQYIQTLIDAIYESAAAGREVRIKPSSLA